jgi:hypothetical protein
MSEGFSSYLVGRPTLAGEEFLHAANEFGTAHADSSGDFDQLPDRRILQAAFEKTHVGSMDICPRSKLLLRDPGTRSQFPEYVPYRLLRLQHFPAKA